jgi:hypothetical protein
MEVRKEGELTRLTLLLIASVVALASALVCLPVRKAIAAIEKKEKKPVDPAILALRSKLNPETPNWSPEYVYERCAEHLATVNVFDRPRIRYFDLSGVPRGLLPTGSASLLFGVPSLCIATVLHQPRPVPNTDNRIYWLDLCWFNWTPETWEKISEEDPYFREPIIPSSSKALEFLKGETNANPVMRWDWLCFYAFDNTQFLKLGEVFNENAFYYQLVYSNVEFVREVEVTVEEKVTTYKTVKKQVFDPRYNGYVIQETQEPVVNVKKTKKKVTKKVRGVGPKNAKELHDAWKVDFRILKDFPIDLGAMIAAGASGVSYENRVLWRIRTAIGIYWRTFDVIRSVGDQDFVETPFPKGFDAGEHIFQDSRGAQYYHSPTARTTRWTSATRASCGTTSPGRESSSLLPRASTATTRESSSSRTRRAGSRT